MALLPPGFGGATLYRDPQVVTPAPKTQRTIRAVTGYGTSSTDITAGALCTITDFRKDFDPTHITELNFCSVTSNLITLTKPGWYLITYHAALFILLQEAATVNPTTTVGKTILKAGSLELSGTAGFVTMTEIPNLNKFVRVDDEEAFQVKVDVGGATGKTDPFGVNYDAPYTFSSAEFTEGQVLTDVSTTFDAINADTLDGSLQQALSLDTNQQLDCTSNASKVTTESTDSYIKGSTSGTALVDCHYNASNVLKIFIGGTEYDPTIGVMGSRETGTADVLNLSTSISLIKLF